MINDDLISAYLDGELNAEQKASLERDLRSDKGAAARLRRLRAADDALRAATPVSRFSGDEALAAMILTAAPVIAKPAPRRRFVEFAALSAAMVLGVAVGRFAGVDGEEGAAPFSISAAEAHLLDTLPSGRAVAIEPGVFEVSLSLQSDAGQVCRQYSLSNAESAVDVLACKSADTPWRMAAAAPHVDVAGYTAAGASSAIDAAISALGPVEALDRAQEQDLIRRDWR